GFGSLETWGGATIDSCLRFLGENPFDRLDTIKKATPKTPHMMLLRGQNIVQYAHFADDVVETFIHTSAKHGMDIFRIFDALNDTRNMQCAIEATKAAGKQAHGTICYTSSPVHTTQKFVDTGIEMAEMGCDAIVIKDMAGLIPPYVAAQIVKGIKDAINIPVWIHTHETAGLGAATYLAAIDAGVDAIDTSVIPFANGTGQPDTVRMMALLAESPRKPDFDQPEKIGRLNRLRAHFEGVYEELSDFTSHKNEVVDSDALLYQVPGGMLSNFRNQLKEQKMEDKFEDVFAEIPVVREALGWIPLVTPTSQIVGVQAMLNVKFGRWKNMTPQACDIALGYYGRCPAQVDPEVQKLAAKNQGKDPITERPADSIEPGMAKLKETLKEKSLPETDEIAVLYAMFPQEVAKLLQPKPEASATPAEITTSAAVKAGTATKSRPDNALLSLTIEGRTYQVEVEELD
ncbi:MAG: pyruvate carboxylase subunit B, partial [Verrucomicrobiota bacterium]